VSYVAEVAVVGVALPRDEPFPQETVKVLYCDTCHRWGRPGTTHLCGDTWAESLNDLLMALISEQKQSSDQ